MRMHYDPTTGFIWEVTSILGNPEIPNRSYVDKQGYVFEKQPIDTQYYLPNYKVVEGEVVEITDPTDYQSDSKLWKRFLSKVSAEVKVQVERLTSAQLKDIFDASPAYKQQVIYDQIHYYWAEQLPQFNMNLGLEVLCRLMAEYLYITVVNSSSLTTDQQTAFNTIVTALHNHNSMLKANPFDPNSEILDPLAWPQAFIPELLNASDYIRSQCIPQRIYVTGG